MSRYQRAYTRSLEDPAGFWSAAAEGIDWDRRWDQVADDLGSPTNRWFRGGRLNTCFNALDRHVDAGRGEQPALIYDSPMTRTQKSFSYSQLRDRVATCAGALASLGVQRGDRVVIYMPMVPEAVVAMLACARLGAVHSVVFGGFAAQELATRIDDARPRVIVSASCGIEPSRIVEYKPLLDSALELAEHRPAACIILQRSMCPCELRPGVDIDFDEAMVGAQPHDCVVVGATDPLLYPLHLGNHGAAQGRRSRQWRPRSRSALEHAQHLWR